jgi:hypothetical protein
MRIYPACHISNKIGHHTRNRHCKCVFFFVFICTCKMFVDGKVFWTLLMAVVFCSCYILYAVLPCKICFSEHLICDCERLLLLLIAENDGRFLNRQS